MVESSSFLDGYPSTVTNLQNVHDKGGGVYMCENSNEIHILIFLRGVRELSTSNSKYRCIFLIMKRTFSNACWLVADSETRSFRVLLHGGAPSCTRIVILVQAASCDVSDLRRKFYRRTVQCTRSTPVAR